MLLPVTRFEAWTVKSINNATKCYGTLLFRNKIIFSLHCNAHILSVFPRWRVVANMTVVLKKWMLKEMKSSTEELNEVLNPVLSLENMACAKLLFRLQIGILVFRVWKLLGRRRYHTELKMKQQSHPLIFFTISFKSQMYRDSRHDDTVLQAPPSGLVTSVSINK